MGDVTGRGAAGRGADRPGAPHPAQRGRGCSAIPLRAVEELNSVADRAPSELSICTVVVVLLTPTAVGRDRRRSSARGTRRRSSSATARGPAQGRPGPMVGAWDDGAWRARDGGPRAPATCSLLHTDGVTDTVGADGRFGDARLAEALRGAADAERRHRPDRRARSRRFERGSQADDTALLAVRLLSARLARAAPRGLGLQRPLDGPAEPASVGRAAHRGAGFAREAGIDGEGLADLRLAVSEALTNAVVHGYPAARRGSAAGPRDRAGGRDRGRRAGRRRRAAPAVRQPRDGPRHAADRGARRRVERAPRGGRRNGRPDVVRAHGRARRAHGAPPRWGDGRGPAMSGGRPISGCCGWHPSRTIIDRPDPARRLS